MGGTYVDCEGTITYTYVYTDCEGNTQDWVYTYTIDHITAPVVPANGASSVQCLASATAPTTPSVTDACGTVIIPTGPVITDAINPTTMEGTRTYTYTYTDCSGLVSTWKFVYTIDDNTPPTITAPSAITAPVSTTNCSAIISSLGTPTGVGDNCSTPIVTWSASGATPSNGNVSATNIKFPIGVTTVVWTATDAAGNTKTATQTVTVTTTLAATSVILSGNNICSGTTVNLSFTITGGSSPYTIVYNNGTSNVTVNNYTSGQLLPVTVTSTTTFRVVSVTDANGCTVIPSVTVSATLSVNKIIRANLDNSVLGGVSSPSGTLICPNAPIPFPIITVLFNGNETKIFVYAINGVPQPAVTVSSNRYQIQTTVAGMYTLFSVTDASGCPGVVSTDKITIIDGKPNITVQPIPQTPCIGTSFTLSVTVTSPVTPTYQWRKNGNIIPGATNSFYTVSSTTVADFGNYDVVITNGNCGSTTSNIITVSNCSVTIDVVAALEGALLTTGNGSHAAFMPPPVGLTNAQLIGYDIVDYITVELRKSGMAGANTVIQSQQAMIKKNGHIVALDGVSPLTFIGVPAGNYNVAVIHRFHLPIRTTTGVSMSASGVTAIDLTIAGNVIGAKLVGAKYAMYVGEINASGRIAANDILAVNYQNGTFMSIANYATTFDVNFSGRVAANDVLFCNANNGVFGVNLNQ